jgi:hypothetical protein
MTSDLQKEMRLGNLLIQLKLLSQADLSEATQLAVELSLPLGKVLVMSGFLTDQQLQAIVHAQSMLKDQIISIDIAEQALKLVSDERISWEEGLQRSGWLHPDLMPANKLGKLLTDAGIITQEELDLALISAHESNLPLGRILLLSKKLSHAVLSSCLNAQVLLRDAKINREQAINALRLAQQRDMSVDQALEQQGLYKSATKARIKIGEMFVLSGVLNEETMMDAIETGLLSDMPVGQVLLQHGHININLLDSALKLQEMVDSGAITPIGSADVLKLANSRTITVAQAITEMGMQRTPPPAGVNLTDLLKMSGIVTEDDVQDAFRQTLQNSALMCKLLSVTGCVDDDTLNAALRCQSLLKQGALQQDQAIVALNYCQKMHCSLEDALAVLGWSMLLDNLPKPKGPRDTGTNATTKSVADMIGFNG